ncbi:MAG: HEAT repeat domain-containing protein [Acidobacteriota bacterium]
MRSKSWDEIRAHFHETGTQALHEAVVRVGKVKAEKLPDDIADAIIALFDHPDPEVRAEAVRAIGVHWRLARAVRALAEVLKRDGDLQVQLSAISGLGAIARENADIRCFVSKVLAGVVLDEHFADYERMTAYLELLHSEGKIGFKEYTARNRDIPSTMANFDIDRPWVEELAQCDHPES